MSNSPFRKANRVARKLKLLVYGKSGLGKTRLALSLPGLAMIDMERGTDWYGDQFPFDVFHTKSVTELTEAINWLVANGQGQYRTIAIDPITILYEQMQMAHQRVAERRTARKGGDTEDVNLTPRDWGRLKGKWNDLFTQIVNGGFHFVAVAKEKDKRRGEDVIGVKPGAETDAEYWFDTLVRLVEEGGKITALVEKDRTGLLVDKRFTYEALKDRIIEIAEATQDAEAEAEVAQPATWERDSEQVEHEETPKPVVSHLDGVGCPRGCGGVMKLRKSKTGSDFYGCSNFAVNKGGCKATMNPELYAKAVEEAAGEATTPRKPLELWEQNDLAWQQHWRNECIRQGIAEDKIFTPDGRSPDDLPWELRADFLAEIPHMAAVLNQDDKDLFADM